MTDNINPTETKNLMKRYGPNDTIQSVKPIKPNDIYVSTSSEVYLPNGMTTRDDLVKYIEKIAVIE